MKQPQRDAIYPRMLTKLLGLRSTNQKLISPQNLNVLVLEFYSSTSGPISVLNKARVVTMVHGHEHYKISDIPLEAAVRAYRDVQRQWARGRRARKKEEAAAQAVTENEKPTSLKEELLDIAANLETQSGRLIDLAGRVEGVDDVRAALAKLDVA